MGYSPWGHKESDTTERLHFSSTKLLKGLWCNLLILNLLNKERRFSSICLRQKLFLLTKPGRRYGERI